jgi:ATP-dependent Clp protease adaptor protein ClpS
MAAESGVLPENDAGTEQQVREPKFYRVLLLNDDYTTMDFVIEVLMTVFHKPAAEAARIMLDVHRRGRGTCGVFTYDVAATKISVVHRMARKRAFPLRCSLEEA